MNRLSLDQLPQSVMTGVAIAFGHVLVLALAGLIGLALWVRAIAPAMGLNDRTLHVQGPLIAIIVLAYISFLTMWKWRKRTDSQ